MLPNSRGAKMPDLNTNDAAMRDVLTDARVVAVVGHSDNPSRTSYQIAQFLRRVGYTVYAVNPTVSQIDGQPCYASLKDVPEPIDIVDVFRRSEFLPSVVDDAIEAGATTVWSQLGVYDKQAGQKALDAGMNVAMDVCIKVEFMRLEVKLTT
jgi:uncharacterized protein